VLGIVYYYYYYYYLLLIISYYFIIIMVFIINYFFLHCFLKSQINFMFATIRREFLQSMLYRFFLRTHFLKNNRGRKVLQTDIVHCVLMILSIH